jgi:hypothetical protein
MFSSVTIPGTFPVGVLQKNEGAITVDIERVALDTDKLSFAALTNLTAAPVGTPAESQAIACEGAGRIVVKVEYSNVNVLAALWVVLIDANGLRSYQPKMEPQNTGDQQGVTQTGYYHGEVFSVPTHGASSFAVRMAAGTPVNAGNITAWAAAV